jgi:hypothetical protein
MEFQRRLAILLQVFGGFLVFFGSASISVATLIDQGSSHNMTHCRPVKNQTDSAG